MTFDANAIFQKYDDGFSLSDGKFTVTSKSKNIARVDINYYSYRGYKYAPNSVTADSGTFNDDYTDWRAHGILTNSVTFTMDANTETNWRGETTESYTIITSIVVYLAN